MTSANQQIVTLYETSGLDPESIAKEFDWDVAAVKVVLTQCSMVYRSSLKAEDKAIAKGEDPQLFTSEEELLAKETMINILQCSEDDNAKARIAKFIINERKGRHDLKKLRDVNLNIGLINEHMQKAREVIAEAKRFSRAKPLLEVSSEDLSRPANS